MSSMPRWAEGNAESAAQAHVSPHFPATLGRFDERADRAVIDGLTRWVEERYRDELARRPSMHVYVRTLPGPVIGQIDQLRDSPLIRSLIMAQAPAGSVMTPMKHTDELYVSHYNKDHGGDQGLFDRHYDGNLRFLSSSMVVRALIYLQSDATYTVVFGDSGIEGVCDLRVRPARLSPRAALGRGALRPGRPPAHPSQVQLPGDAPQRGSPGAARAGRQHRRVLRREGGDGILQEPTHAAAGRGRTFMQPLPPAEQRPSADSAGVDCRRRRRDRLGDGPGDRAPAGLGVRQLPPAGGTV
jgi:hypothetical protein